MSSIAEAATPSRNDTEEQMFGWIKDISPENSTLKQLIQTQTLTDKKLYQRIMSAFGDLIGDWDFDGDDKNLTEKLYFDFFSGRVTLDQFIYIFKDFGSKDDMDAILSCIYKLTEQDDYDEFMKSWEHYSNQRDVLTDAYQFYRAATETTSNEPEKKTADALEKENEKLKKENKNLKKEYYDYYELERENSIARHHLEGVDCNHCGVHFIMDCRCGFQCDACGKEVLYNEATDKWYFPCGATWNSTDTCTLTT